MTAGSVGAQADIQAGGSRRRGREKLLSHKELSTKSGRNPQIYNIVEVNSAVSPGLLCNKHLLLG